MTTPERPHHLYELYEFATAGSFFGPAGCVTRYTFTREQSGTPLRMLDLYVTTDHTAACHAS